MILSRGLHSHINRESQCLKQTFSCFRHLASQSGSLPRQASELVPRRTDTHFPALIRRKKNEANSDAFKKI